MKKKIGYHQRLLKACRQEWSRHNPDRKKCFEAARFKIDGLDKWKCEHCKQFFAKSEVDCDHKKPVGKSAPQSDEELFECLKRMNCSFMDLQILCKHTCHRLKTKGEANNRMRHTLIHFISPYGPSVSDLETLDTPVLKAMVKNIQAMRHPDDIKKERAQQRFHALTEKYL